MFLNTIKKIFVKEKIFECIVWDGKTMKYLDLNQKQIDEINNNLEYKDWTVTLKDEC